MKSKEVLLGLVKKYIDLNYIDPKGPKIYCCKMMKKSIISLEDIESKLTNTWSEDVFYIIDIKSLKEPDVYKKACISKQTFSNIRSNKDYKPKKDTDIQLCIGLEANIDQTVDLLGKAGYHLSSAIKRDLVVEYFIKNEIYDMYELNNVLYDLELELFNLN